MGNHIIRKALENGRSLQHAWNIFENAVEDCRIIEAIEHAVLADDNEGRDDLDLARALCNVSSKALYAAQAAITEEIDCRTAGLDEDEIGEMGINDIPDIYQMVELTSPDFHLKRPDDINEYVSDDRLILCLRMRCIALGASQKWVNHDNKTSLFTLLNELEKLSNRSTNELQRTALKLGAKKKEIRGLSKRTLINLIMSIRNDDDDEDEEVVATVEEVQRSLVARLQYLGAKTEWNAELADQDLDTLWDLIVKLHPMAYISEVTALREFAKSLGILPKAIGGYEFYELREYIVWNALMDMEMDVTIDPDILTVNDDSEDEDDDYDLADGDEDSDEELFGVDEDEDDEDDDDEDLEDDDDDEDEKPTYTLTKKASRDTNDEECDDDEDEDDPDDDDPGIVKLTEYGYSTVYAASLSEHKICLICQGIDDIDSMKRNALRKRATTYGAKIEKIRPYHLTKLRKVTYMLERVINDKDAIITHYNKKHLVRAAIATGVNRHLKPWDHYAIAELIKLIKDNYVVCSEEFDVFGARKVLCNFGFSKTYAKHMAEIDVKYWFEQISFKELMTNDEIQDEITRYGVKKASLNKIRKYDLIAIWATLRRCMSLKKGAKYIMFDRDSLILTHRVIFPGVTGLGNMKMRVLANAIQDAVRDHITDI